MKKKMKLAMCAALALSLGATPVFATAPGDHTLTTETQRIFVTHSGQFAEGEHEFLRFMVKIEDGQRLFSTDGGETWSETPMEGVEIRDDTFIVRGLAGTDAFEGMGNYLFRVVDGTFYHSTDEGETWVVGMPEGLEFNSSIIAEMPTGQTFQNRAINLADMADLEVLQEGARVRIKQADEMGDFLFRVNDGIFEHSTDNGETWVEGRPIIAE